MNILADTNIWCRYFRAEEPTLSGFIEYDFITMHPIVIGELAVGNLPSRKQTLIDFQTLPSLRPASVEETHTFLEKHKLWGKGLQWNDLLILASVITTPGTLLWTYDKRLANVAERLSVAYCP